MLRPLIAILATLAFVVSATPAFGQAVDEPTTTEPAQPTLIAREVIEVTKTGFSVAGRSVEAAPTGVEVTLTLTFENTTREILKDVNVTLAETRGIRLTDAEASIGSLHGGESADGEFAFVVEAADCFEFVGVGGEATYDGGAVPLKIAIPTACPGPRLALGDVTFQGGDVDGVPEPGETLRVFFELFNQGRDPALDVRAHVKVSGIGLTVAGNELSWPDIEPGGSARNVAPLILSISKAATRQETCMPGPPEPGVAEDSDALPSDSVVSSDGKITSPAAGRDAPGDAPPSGGGSDPSQGSRVGATAEEPPTGSTLDEPTTIEPEPLPAPIEPLTEPAPANNQPVQIQAALAVSARDYEVDLAWVNQIMCALEGVPVADGLGAKRLRDDSRTQGAVVPVTLALVVSLLAATAHRKFVG